MITELFSKRYKKVYDYELFTNGNFDQNIIFNQLFSILKNDLVRSLGGVEERGHITYRFECAEDKFCRENGIENLSIYQEEIGNPKIPNYQYSEARCKYFLLVSSNLWREKLSLLELLIREYEGFHNEEIRFLEEQISNPPKLAFKRVFSDPYKGTNLTLEDKINNKKRCYDEGINEINTRLSDVGLKLRYSNGYFLKSEDNLSTQMIEKPFWDLVRNSPEYQNVEKDMLEAMDYQAQGKHDKAAQHAFMAFESALKIKFQVAGKTTFQKLVDGSLAKYSAISKFLHLQYLKDQNSYFRNESSHGPGKQKRNVPLKEEVDFAISLCMSCIRLLLAKN